MRLSRWDGLATVVFAAVAVPYVGYLVRGSMPFVQDPRGMSGVGLVGLVVGIVVWALAVRNTDRSRAETTVLGGLALVALGLGVAALVAETSEVLLAAFMAAIALVWLADLAMHAGLVHATSA